MLCESDFALVLFLLVDLNLGLGGWDRGLGTKGKGNAGLES